MQVDVRRAPITPCGVSAWVDVRQEDRVVVHLKESEYTELDRRRIEHQLLAEIAESGTTPVSRYRHLLLVHTG